MSLSKRLLVPLLVYLAVTLTFLAFSPTTISTPVRSNELVVLVLLSLVLAIVIVWTIHKALRPLRTLVDQVENLDVTDVAHAHPLPVPPQTELAALTTAYNDMLGRLAAANEEMALVRLRAQERERATIGHELEDDLGARLTALHKRLDAIRPSDDPRVAAEVADVRTQARELAGDCKRISRELIPGEIGKNGLAPSLRELGQRVRAASGIEVHMAIADPGSLSTEAQLVVYRVAQESLANVVQHSGATRVGMRLVSNPDDCLLEIVDNGSGGVDESGPGIRGMRDRADAVRGRLIVQAILGDGVRVRLRVPRVPGQRLAPPLPAGPIVVPGTPTGRTGTFPRVEHPDDAKSRPSHAGH